MTPISVSSSPSLALNVTMSTIPTTTWTDVPRQNLSVINISRLEPELGSGAPVTFVLNRVYSLATSHASSALASRPKWTDKEYRQAYLEAAVEQGVAWQIRANRKARGWSQQDFAHRLGTQQSAVSRLEDPTYGRHTLETLVNVADVFDCALSVRLVSYSVLAAESIDLTPEAMVVKSFSDEILELEGHLAHIES